jgi:type IV pilus assembly protein PilA
VLNRLHTRLKGDEGFTLIELLVVILIIGILAAIAIPSFLNQKGKGEDAAAKSSARSAQTALETYYTDNQTYNCGSGAACGTALSAIENSLPTYDTASPPAANKLTVTDTAAAGANGTAGSATASTYRVAVASNPSGRVYWIDKSSTGVTRGCYVPSTANSTGGCKGATVGGFGTW